MFKISRLVITCGPRILHDYFSWILKYSRQPEKYPIEEKYAKARSLILFVFKKMHVDLSVEGYEYLKNLDRKTLIIPNHQSIIDIMLLISLSPQPIVFIGKKEVVKMPFVSKIMKGIDGLFLDRGNARQSIETLKKASEIIKTNYAHVCVYPEGHRNRKPYGDLLDFHAGSFKVAYWAEAPIMLVSEMGTFRVVTPKYQYRRFLISMKFFKPLEPQEFKSLPTTDFAPQAREKITETLSLFINKDKEFIQNKVYKKSLKHEPKWWDVLKID